MNLETAIADMNAELAKAPQIRSTYEGICGRTFVDWPPKADAIRRKVRAAMLAAAEMGHHCYVWEVEAEIHAQFKEGARR